ncbi:MAG: MSCRAMM family protein [Thermomicrobiales bacterium]
MGKGRTFRYLMTLVTLVMLFASASIVRGQAPATPIAVPTVAPTKTVEVTPTIEPAAEASPTATPVSGVVDNGDGSYTLTANAGDVTDLDLSALLPSGGITFDQLVSLSATIVSVDGSCGNSSPVFYLNDFGDDAPTQGLLIAIGDPGNSFACSPGATGNLIENGLRFFTYHPDQSGGPSDGSYQSMVNWIGNTNLPGMKFRLDNSDGSSPASITIGDFSMLTAPTATLNVTVQLCQTSDAGALTRKVDYTLDPFGPAAVPDCTPLDPSGIPIATSLLDTNGDVFATFDATAQSDGSISPTIDLGSATSLQFGEGLFGTISNPLAIPSGGGANVGITLYVAGLPGSVTVGLVNSITNSGLSGSTFSLYFDDCSGTPIRTATTDNSGNAVFNLVLDGTYCVAQTAPRSGYQPIAPIPPFTVSGGQAVVLGPFASAPPTATLTVNFVDSYNGNAPVPHICAGIFEHSGFPDGTPTGELAPIQCDTDGDAAIAYTVPIDVSFEVTVRVLPLGWVVGGSAVGKLSPDNLSGGSALTQDVYGGYSGSGPVDITSLFCPVSDASQAQVVIEIDDGDQPGATPIPTTGCAPFDAAFSVVPYGIGNGYTPITVSTVDGAGSLQLPYTGEVVGSVLPNTLHAFIDDARGGASGQSATFELPSDGISPAKITIVIYGVPISPTATATAEPTATITTTPDSTTTPVPLSTVVALPNTGAGGNSSSGSISMVALLLAMFGVLVIVTRRIAMRTR